MKSHSLLKITYSGYKIDKHGIHETQDKTGAILNVSIPIKISQIKTFLGLGT